MPYHLLTFQCDYPINKDILLPNHTTTKKIRKLILLILRPIHVLLIVLMSFVVKGSSSESNVAFSCHASLVGFNMEQFLSLSLGFMTLTLCKITGQLFCTPFLNMMFPSDQIQVMYLWHKCHISEAVFCLIVSCQVPHNFDLSCYL